METKSRKTFQPGYAYCFILMACFCLAAALMQNYYLAGIGMALTVAMSVIYSAGRKRRSREIQAFVQAAFQTADITAQGTENPLPMAMVRLGDGGIVWASERFVSVTGMQERLPEDTIGRLLPGLSMDWLATGKNEYPYDVKVGSRRYRVYGTLVHPEEHAGVLLGMIYLSDATEMYQVRDEYIRSRPVVAIILVDNYEELTMNLSESTISTMDADINNAITTRSEEHTLNSSHAT